LTALVDGRAQVCIVFDTDRRATSRANVKHAASVFAAHLAHRCDKVRIIPVPLPPGAGKGALDDYLRAGGLLRDLLNSGDEPITTAVAELLRDFAMLADSGR